MNMSYLKKWFDQMGEVFLIDIGIEPNDSVIDFGCGKGTYTIPAARIVGEKGTVYAIDKNKETLDELIQKSQKMGLKNIKRIDVLKEIQVPLQKESIDVVLLYDVIHLVDDRKKLLTEINQVLKPNALLSVYPKHHQEKMNMELDDVKEKIESVGFRFERMFNKTLMHDDSLEQGYILNFRKVHVGKFQTLLLMNDKEQEKVLKDEKEVIKELIK
jgi:ubiquinone/menaquinone biosynthesis C-methylase UbiE